MAPDDLIDPLDHYPAEWELTSNRPLDGTVAIAFTLQGRRPGADNDWHAATWASDVVDVVRVVQLTVAGSDAAAAGAHPGIGDFTAHLRYTAPDGAVRTRPGGIYRFR